MNKKVIIGAIAGVVLAGGVIAAIALNNKNDGGDTNISGRTKETNEYALESVTTGNKIKVQIAKDLGYEKSDSVTGSLILIHPTNGSEITFYYKHTSLDSIIAGEKSYSSSPYYDYREFEIDGRSANEVKYQKQDDGTPFRIEFNMAIGQDESDKCYDGVSIRFQRPATEFDEKINIQDLYESDDIQQMIKSIKLEKSTNDKSES